MDKWTKGNSCNPSWKCITRHKKKKHNFKRLIFWARDLFKIFG